MESLEIGKYIDLNRNKKKLKTLERKYKIQFMRENEENRENEEK